MGIFFLDFLPLSLRLGVQRLFLNVETMNLDLSHLICINGFRRFFLSLSNKRRALYKIMWVCVRVCISDFSSPKKKNGSNALRVIIDFLISFFHNQKIVLIKPILCSKCLYNKY